MIQEKYLDLMFAALQGEGWDKNVEILEGDIDKDTKRIYFNITCSMHKEGEFERFKKCVDDCNDVDRQDDIASIFKACFGNPIECYAAKNTTNSK